MLAEETGSLVQAVYRVLQLTLADGGSSDDQCAIFDGFGNGLELFSTGEQSFGANGGTRFTKSQLIGGHDAKMEEAEVAHGPGRTAEVAGIPGGDSEDPARV